MCGIVGYIGTKEAYPILIKGLHRLEYRGYDSAGIALISDNQELNVYKTKGKVADLERFAETHIICQNAAETATFNRTQPLIPLCLILAHRILKRFRYFII